MITFRYAAVFVASLLVVPASASSQEPTVDRAMVAKIREEGLQRSQVMDIASYISDILGARLTLSNDMKRAQAWAKAQMDTMGLVRTAIEPFMDYGVSWDNEYVSLHMVEPDYQPMVGYPLAHTPGTNGRKTLRTIIADVRTKQDLAALRGKLKGMAVLSTPPAVVDLTRFSTGVARRTDEELKRFEQAQPPVAAPTLPTPRNPDVLTPEEKLDFYKAEGVAAVLECSSGWPGAVRGFARPGTRTDRWGREPSLASPPIVAITPEHYNRMYRILKRGVPVSIDIDIRNRIGETREQAANVVGEIAGSDLASEIVMIGAHFDTWHASPNSSDNTSGVAVMLEAMRILKAVGARPRRTIRVALWAGEEQGIHGSREYVLKHFGSPTDSTHRVTPEYEKFSVYFNQDYGPGQYRGIWLQGNEHARSIFTAWIEPFRDLGMTTVSILGVGSTDHVAFDNAGLPGLQFIQDPIGGTGGHTNLDFFDTLPAEDLMKNATIVAAFAYHAAMSNERMPRKGR